MSLHSSTRKQSEMLGPSQNGLWMLESISYLESYLDMLLLGENACVIITDSGGVYKEAFFRVSCVTLRENTKCLVWVRNRLSSMAMYEI